MSDENETNESDGDATDVDTEAEAEAPTDTDGEEVDETETAEAKTDGGVAASEAATDDLPEGGPVPIGVKLGSTRTVVVAPDGEDNGERELATLTCLATYEHALTGEEKALYGEEAAREYPDRVEYMLRSGLPEDDDRAALAATFFKEFMHANELPADSVVVYAIPMIDNEPGLRNLETVIERAALGERLVRSYPESLCGTIPAFGDGLEALDETFVVVNMGSTNLETGAYRRGELLGQFATGAVTGNEVDRRIAAYVESETQGRVNIDETTAREYKEEHADFEDFSSFSDVIQQPGGGSHEFTIETSVMDALDEYLDEAVEEIANVFLPELASDHIRIYRRTLDEPIVLTGGMANVPGIVDEFESRLSAALDHEVTARAPDEPTLAPARGAHRIASRFVEIEEW